MANEQPSLLLTDDIRELLHLIKDSDLAEVLIERGDARVHVKRAVPAPQLVNMVAPGSMAPAAYGYNAPGTAVQVATGMPVSEVEVAAEVVVGITVAAPMVGTYYAAPTPKDPPYVRVGDEVRPGDVLGIIEAMKIMNEIEAEVHGRVTRVLVENGQPVEYGQPLLVIEPIG